MHGNTKLKCIDAKQAKDFFKYKNTKSMFLLITNIPLSLLTYFYTVNGLLRVAFFKLIILSHQSQKLDLALPTDICTRDELYCDFCEFVTKYYMLYAAETCSPSQELIL